MTQDVKVNVTRILVILSAIGALVVLLAAFRSFGDDRYVTRREYSEELAAMQSDMRALRCQLLKDCSP